MLTDSVIIIIFFLSFGVLNSTVVSNSYPHICCVLIQPHSDGGTVKTVTKIRPIHDVLL